MAGRFLDQLGTNASAAGDGLTSLATNIFNRVSHPHFLTGGDVLNAGSDVWSALTGAASQSVAQGKRAVTQAPGIAFNPATYLPGIGNDLLNLNQRVQSRDWGGAAADALSLGAQVAAPEIGEAAANPFASSAEGIYRGTLPLKKALSLEDMKAATQFGLAEGLPRSEASLARLGSVNEAGTYLGDLEKQVQDQLNAYGRANLPIDLKVAA